MGFCVANLSGLDLVNGDAKKGPRYMTNWRARYFLADKRISHATISAIYQGGFTLSCHQGIPVGKTMNLEFIVNYKDTPTRVRLKATVDYCLIRSNSPGADVDVAITQIPAHDKHVVNNLLQIMSSSKAFNLRI